MMRSRSSPVPPVGTKVPTVLLFGFRRSASSVRAYELEKLVPSRLCSYVPVAEKMALMR